MNARSPQAWTNDGGDLFARAAAELEILHRRRERVPANRISDQQWGILLELFVADESGRDLPTGALQEAAGAPHSTLVRLINDLAARGLVERDRDRSDRRLTIIRPTAKARAIVAEVFDDRGRDAA